jgi:hypothetical protein
MCVAMMLHIWLVRLFIGRWPWLRIHLQNIQLDRSTEIQRTFEECCEKKKSQIPCAGNGLFVKDSYLSNGTILKKNKLSKLINDKHKPAFTITNNSFDLKQWNDYESSSNKSDDYNCETLENKDVKITSSVSHGYELYRKYSYVWLFFE